MKSVKLIEIHDNICHVYIDIDKVLNGWDWVPETINKFIKSYNYNDINATFIHYKGILFSKEYIKNNDMELMKTPDNVSMDWLYENIYNLYMCFNNAGMDKEELNSFYDCIKQSKNGTSENILFADPDWEYI